MQYVDVVVGGQYGSEAKGHVTAQLVRQARRVLDLAIQSGDVEADKADVFNVRVAGPNAGHTVYDAEGNKFALRTIPVGAVYEGVNLYIAPGSEVDLDVLQSEIDLLESHGHQVVGRLFISKQATVIDPGHKIEEAALVGNIGSTGKGIGAARAARLMRTARTMWEAHQDAPYDDVLWEWAEPEDLYAHDDIVHQRSQHVIIEGTQGFGLSLRASGHYPQVTSSDARAVDFLAMAGVDPTRCSVNVTNWVVARVFPIRVAGNSGPMKGETTWDDLGLDPELTTVTQKVRRVGEWDIDLLKRAVQANGGHRAKVIVTMLDQVVPALKECEGSTLTAGDIEPNEAFDQAIAWIEEHTADLGADVAGFTFSPVDLLFTQHANEGRQDGPQIDEKAMEAAVAAALGEMFGIDMKAGE